MSYINKIGILRKSKELEGKGEANLIIPRSNIIWGLNIKFSQELTGNQSKKRENMENSRIFIIRKKKAPFSLQRDIFFPNSPKLRKKSIF